MRLLLRLVAHILKDILKGDRDAWAALWFLTRQGVTIVGSVVALLAVVIFLLSLVIGPSTASSGYSDDDCSAYSAQIGC